MVDDDNFVYLEHSGKNTGRRGGGVSFSVVRMEVDILEAEAILLRKLEKIANIHVLCFLHKFETRKMIT